MKKRLNAFAKSIDTRQPALSARVNVGQNFSLSLNFLISNDRSIILSRAPLPNR